MSGPGFEPSRRTLWVVALLLPLVVAALTLPAASPYLWEEDTVGFALALESFSLADYTPHPPGYLFYVMLAKAASGWFGGPNETFLALGLVANVLTAYLVLWLGSAVAGRSVGVLGAILWPLNSIVWFYGQVSTVYPFEALCGAAVAASTYRMLQGRRPWVFISAAVLGLAGGLRGFVVVLLFPLWVYAVLRSTDGWRDRAGALAVLAMAYGAWLLPTLYLAGGYGAYAEASRRLFAYNLRRTSVLWTADPSTALFNLALYGLFALAGLGLLGFLAVASGIVWPAARRWYRRRPWDGRLVWFFGLWIGVPSLFFVLFHLPKPGYLMVFLPAWVILISWAALEASSALLPNRPGQRRALLWSIVAAHLLVAAALHLEVTRALIIRPTVSNMDRLISYVRGGACGEPKGCLMVTYGLPWRTVAYYLPEVRLVALADEASTWYPDYGAEAAFSLGRETRYASGTVTWAARTRPSVVEVPVPLEVKTVLWYVDARSELFGSLKEAVALEGPLFSQELGPGALYATPREGLGLPLKVGAFVLAAEGGEPWWGLSRPPPTSAPRVAGRLLRRNGRLPPAGEASSLPAGCSRRYPAGRGCR